MTSLRVFWLALLLIIAANITGANGFDLGQLDIGQRYWRSYNPTDGLPGAKVTAIVQDRQGYLWFGTLGGGVSRFDGQEWTNFSTDEGLVSNNVQAIFQDDEGVFWFGTEGGVSRFDGKEWTTYTRADGLASNFVPVIMQDREGRMWFGSGDLYGAHGQGVSRFDGQQWLRFGVNDGLAGNWVGAMVQDREGNLWFGTEAGVSHYAMGRFSGDGGLSGQRVRALLEDSQGRLWCGTDSGIRRYDGKTFNPSPIFADYQDIEVRDLLEDRQGRLWVATYGQGALLLDNHKLRSFTSGDGLAHNWVFAVFQDHEGHFWFGTDGKGASRYNENLLNFTTADGLASNMVVALLPDKDGALWLGTDGGGVSKFDGERFTTYTTADGLASNHVRVIVQDKDGALWLGTDGGGISKFDGAGFTTYTTADGLASNHVYSGMLAADGALWFGTGSFAAVGRGVSRFDGETWHTLSRRDGLADPTVSAICQDLLGRIWFGTTNGISRYDGGDFTNFTDDERLVNRQVRAIVNDHSGDLWFGTEGGISRLSVKDTTVTIFTTKDGLADNQIRAIYHDSRGHFWFGTLGGGVSRYDGQVFQRMTRKDGLAEDGVYAIAEDRDGNLWFGTLGGGVTRYRPPKAAPPAVFIDAVVANQRFDGNTREALEVPSSVGLVAFEFHSISYKTRPAEMIYRYRLRGYQDDAWHVTRQRFKEYQNLPTGEYIFEVQGVDRDLVYSSTLAAQRLNVVYQPMSSSVKIEDLKVKDVFSSYYKTYAEDQVGEVEVVNNDPNPVEAKLSFYIPDFMARPTEQTITLMPHSSQRIALKAILDPVVLNLEGDRSVTAEVELACEIGDAAQPQTISIQETRPIVIYGRGVLQWDELGRAAAFVTPEATQVTAFSRGLYEMYRHQLKTNPSDGDLLTAMLLFEGLNAYGIQYAQDSSTPYSQVQADRTVLDNIQYPAELLQSKLGDCDDCTVLYCSLLENLNIATAFVDAPAHILMLFDSGISTQRQYGMRLGKASYIQRGNRYWIPVEVTKLGEGTFMEAWKLGAEIVGRMAAQGTLRITDVRQAWSRFPYALPVNETTVKLPLGEGFNRTFLDNMRLFHKQREDYIKETYINPLEKDPSDHQKRFNLVRTKLESEDFNDAISNAIPLLNTPYRAEAYYLIGCAYASQDDIEQAYASMHQAVNEAPNNEDFRQGLEVLKKMRKKK